MGTCGELLGRSVSPETSVRCHVRGKETSPLGHGSSQSPRKSRLKRVVHLPQNGIPLVLTHSHFAGTPDLSGGVHPRPRPRPRLKLGTGVVVDPARLGAKESGAKDTETPFLPPQTPEKKKRWGGGGKKDLKENRWAGRSAAFPKSQKENLEFDSCFCWFLGLGNSEKQT